MTDTPPMTLDPPAPVRQGIAADWMLDPAITYLNHGSFGARTRGVHASFLAWTERFERSPVELMDRHRDDAVAASRQALGSMLNMRDDEFGLVMNATDGVNSVLRSLQFGPGDELLTTDHVYNAVRQTMRMIAKRDGADYRELAVSIPVTSAEEISDAVCAAIGDRTKLVVIDHVTSPTAIVFPVERIVACCRERGVEILVDGAHAPGMLDLDVTSIGATYYTGNLHKWVCTPVGAAFLWVDRSRRDDIHPSTISHFYEEGLAREFSWQGTRDHSPWYCIADAIAYFDELGWENVRRHNDQLARWAHDMLVDRLRLEPVTPRNGTLLGSIASIEIPALPGFDASEDLTRHLYEAHGIEVPVFPWRDDRRLLRVSAQVYNHPAQYERLADVLEPMLA